MPYASLEQLTDRFGERLLISVTDRGETATDTIDTDVVDRALADTDAVIDGFLAGRYVTPIEAAPPMVVDLALTIAIYKLHVFAPDEKIKDDYKAALQMLRQASEGIVQLPLPTGEQPEDTGSGGVQVTDRERPMTQDSLKGFI